MNRVSDEQLDQLIDNWKYDLGDDSTDELVYPSLLELRARREAERPDPLDEGDGVERL